MTDTPNPEPTFTTRAEIAASNAPTCIECGSRAFLTDGRAIYPHRPDLYRKRFWLCQCGAYCGCHHGTSDALGYPCGPETRKARSAAHAAFDPLWRSGKMQRGQAYRWLSQATGVSFDQCHIGMMTAEQARSVCQSVAAYLKEQSSHA